MVDAVFFVSEEDNEEIEELVAEVSESEFSDLVLKVIAVL